MNTDYIALEKELAELLGYFDVTKSNFYGDSCLVAGSLEGRKYLPKWTSDDAAAFQLMVEYSIDVTHCEDWAVNTYIEGNSQGNLCEFKDYPDKATALRVSIVASVIMKLKESK